ncbi:MAG: hypothetical protein JWN43_3078 [Gammaproteobacteria bacterium]|nr:hypothetical protein [Gammaproteobacteria bacterium]
MISKLEIYGIVLAILALGFVGAYFKGRLDEKAAITTKQLADNASDMTKYQTTLAGRADADEAARKKTADFIVSIDQGLANVQAKFSKLPNVVVDARGCPALTPAAGLHWNAVELLPAGPAEQPAGSAPNPVPTAAVPST